MTPANWRLAGGILLAANFLLLLVLVLGMAGVIPRLPETRGLILVALVLSVVARGLRRRGRVAPTVIPNTSGRT